MQQHFTSGRGGIITTPAVDPRPGGADDYRKSHRTSIVLLALVVVALVAIPVGTVAVSNSEQTRECTVESTQTAYVRRGPDQRRLATAECGTISTDAGPLIEVIDPDCPYNVVRIGSRYRMTTRGFDVPLPYINQKLVGPVELVYSPPETVCASDSWLIDD